MSSYGVDLDLAEYFSCLVTVCFLQCNSLKCNCILFKERSVTSTRALA